MRVVILGSFAPNSQQRKQVYNQNYLAPTLQAAMGTGGSQMPFVITKKGLNQNVTIWNKFSTSQIK